MDTSLVTLVNPNLAQPLIAPYELDILCTALEEAGFRVEVLDLAFTSDTWKETIAEYFLERDPLLVGVSIRSTDTIRPRLRQMEFLTEHRRMIDAIRMVTSAPLVLGGEGFSAMPFALTEYFDAEYAVKGPGEAAIVHLASALFRQASINTVPGLIINEGGGCITQPIPAFFDQSIRFTLGNRPYRRHSGRLDRVDNAAYYRRGGMGSILTRNGYPHAFMQSLESDAKGKRLTHRSPHAVADELEALCEQGIHDIHTADSEFNLSMMHAERILTEIIVRRTSGGSALRNLRLWVYVQPSPFDAELADLLAAAGCAGIGIAPDHIREDLLDGCKDAVSGSRYDHFADTERVCELAAERAIPVMVQVLLGMPGEDLDTLYKCVDRALALNATVTGFTLGVRVFPYSRLGIRLAEQCGGVRTLPGLQSNCAAEPIVLTPKRLVDTVSYERQFMFDEAGRIRPVYYFSPELPESMSTVHCPSGRWTHTLRALSQRVPASELHRVMLPADPILSKYDESGAIDPFLLALAEQGHKGAYWVHWPKRDVILAGSATG